MNLKELFEQKAILEQQIASARQAELGNAIAEAKKLVEEYALTPEQVFGSRVVATGSMNRKGPKAGGTVAPKYQDPVTGKTWSGRGIAPAWIKDKNKDDFLIK